MYIRSKRADREYKGCGSKPPNNDLVLHKSVRVVLGVYSCFRTCLHIHVAVRFGDYRDYERVYNAVPKVPMKV